MTDKKDQTVEPTQTWAIEDIKAIEVQIGTDLGNAGHLLILGVTAKFYAVTGDKDGAAWMRRVMAGSGFTFDRKRRTDGELSARDQAIVALLRDNAPLTTIADTLGIGVATVHKVKTEQGEVSKGGSKQGAGRVATVTEPAKTEPATTTTETTTETTTTTEPAARRGSWMADPVQVAFHGIAKISEDTDPETQLDAWAVVYAFLIEKSGYDAETLAGRAAKLVESGKAITAAE